MRDPFPDSNKEAHPMLLTVPLRPIQDLMRWRLHRRGFVEGHVSLPEGHVVPSVTYLDGRPRWHAAQEALAEKEARERQETGTASPRAADAPTMDDTTHPVVFLHGLGSSVVTWSNVLLDIGDELPVLAPDLPGYGRTPLPDSRPFATIREKVDTVIGFLEAFEETGPFSLVGQSMGGWIAATVAAEAPHLVERLTLVNPAGAFTPQVFEQRRLFSPQNNIETKALWRAMWHHMPWNVHLFAGTYRESTQLPSVRGFLQSIDEDDFLNERLSDITAPTCLIWGLSDRLIGFDAVRLFQDKVPDLRFRPIPDCGHVPQREAPETFLAYLRPWLHGEEPPEPDRPGVHAAQAAAAEAARIAAENAEAHARLAEEAGVSRDRLRGAVDRYNGMPGQGPSGTKGARPGA